MRDTSCEGLNAPRSAPPQCTHKCIGTLRCRTSSTDGTSSMLPTPCPAPLHLANSPHTRTCELQQTSAMSPLDSSDSRRTKYHATLCCQPAIPPQSLHDGHVVSAMRVGGAGCLDIPMLVFFGRLSGSSPARTSEFRKNVAGTPLTSGV